MRLRIGRLRRVWVAVGVGVVVAVALAASSAVAAAPTVPHVYWSNSFGNTIGQANLDGTGVSQDFITGVVRPVEVAVDGQHIYWTATNTIGRANLDGSDVDPDFIPDADDPAGVAVDAQHIYWGNTDDGGTIARANLDGSDVDPDFISGAGDPEAELAVDGQHVYWANFDRGSIGRANLDGTGVDQDFITATDQPAGVAVDGQHVYWSNFDGGTIGRANLDGTDIDQDFISGHDAPDAVAVDGQHIYWTSGINNTIARANLDGSDVDQSFITGTNGTGGMAVSVPVAQLTPATPSAFAATPLGFLSAPQTLTITNAGQQDLSVGGVSFAGQDPGDFSVGSNGCTGSVAPGGSCTLTVRFLPSAAGSRTATLDIATNDFANSPLQVPLSGTGQAPAQPPNTTAGGNPPPLTTAPGSGPGATAAVPALRSLRVSPKTVRVSGRKAKGKCVAPTTRNRHGAVCTRKAKLTVAFTLTAAAPVKFKLTGKLPGRRAGKRCVAQTKHNSRAKRCMRSVTVKGMAAKEGKVGANRFTLSRKLAPGTYTLTATPAGGVAKKATYKITK